MFVFSYKLAYVHKYQRLRYLSRFFLYVRLVTKEHPLSLFLKFVLLFFFALMDTLVFSSAGLFHCISPSYWFYSLYSTYWFIGAILLFYAAFPFLYDGITKLKCNQIYIVIGSFIVASVCVTFILLTKNRQLYQLVVYSARIPILIIGMLMATRGIWKQKFIILCLIVSIPLVYMLPKDFQRISYSFLAVPLVYYIPFVLDKSHSVVLHTLSFTGVCSLEFYLIHIYLFKNNVLGYADGYFHSQILTSIILLCVVVVCSFIANRIIGLFTNRKIN